MTRRGVLAGATALATLAACSRGRARPDTGRVAHRVVSVSPATTEALFAVGAGDRVVGRSATGPPEATRLPAVGGVIDASFEAIVQLEPDLVVGGPGPSSTTGPQAGSGRGVATWFPAIESFDAIDAMIQGMGDRTGHADQARRVVEDGQTRTAAVERAVAGEPAPESSWCSMSGRSSRRVPGIFMDELMRSAGSVDVLASGGPWQTLGFEEIAGLDPDVLVDASLAGGAAASRVTALAPGWKDVRAVRERHVIAISDPRVLRPGPRVAQRLALLARALHPHADLPEP